MGAGSYIIPIKREFLNLSGGTVSGDTLFTQSLSASTFYSGATDLSDIIGSIYVSFDTGTTRVQNGINTFTGGTQQYPTINVTGITIDNINVSGNSYFITLYSNNLSGGTIYSGATNINSLFADKIHTHSISGITGLQGALDTKSNLSGATFTGLVTMPILTATTISGGTIFSGSTNIEDLFAYKIHTHQISDVIGLSGALSTKANLSGATFTGNIDAPNILSGGTNLNLVFAPIVHTHTISQVTGLQGALDTKANLSGATFTGGVYATTLSGGTIYSGSTNLQNTFNVIYSDLNNKFDKTGGTVSGNVIITGNVEILGTATTINTQTIQAKDNNIVLNFSGTHLTAIGGGVTLVSGQTSGESSELKTNPDGVWMAIPGISSNLVSGGTIFSGSSDINSLFADKVHTHTISQVTGLQGALDTKANLSGATFTGNINATSLSSTTLSGGTIYSAGTDLYNIFLTSATNDITRVQPGLNTYTGGTGNAPTINMSAATLNSLSVSGSSSLGVVSASTIFSASTDLYSIFQVVGSDTPHTTVQNGLNTYTGGTALNPTVNISAATLSSLSVSGNSLFNTISANTISGATFYSGSTPLSTIISNIVNSDNTFVQNGLNTYTGGTALNPTVNISAATLSTLSVSGNSYFSSLSATTLSGGSIYSGSTNIEDLFVALLTGGTDNRIARWDGTSGVQNSLVSISDVGNIIPINSNQSLGFSGSGFSSIHLVGQVFYQSGLTIMSPTLTAITLSNAGNVEFLGLQILPTGELQTIGVGNGTVAPGIRGIGSVELQTQRTSSTQTSSANYSTIGGGASNKADGLSSTVSGGYGNSSSGFGSSVGGGFYNTANGVQSTIPGGRKNTSSGNNSVVGGGYENKSYGNFSSVDGGYTNKAYGKYSSVVGGQYNVASGFTQTVVGKFNKVQGTSSSLVSTDHAFIVGNGTNLSNRSNAFAVSWNNVIQTYAQTGSTFPTANVEDGAIAYSAGTGLYQYISGAWYKFASSTSVTGTTASNVGGTEGVFKQKVGDDLQFKSLSGTTNINLASSSNEIAVYLKDNIKINSLSATTISGGTIYSGVTNLEAIIQSFISGSDTFVQNGLNTYTGGTIYRPTVNVSAATLDNVFVSGSSRFNVLTASTLSATTIYSGTTNINNLFADKVHFHGQYATLSGATFTGQVNATSLSSTTISGGTIYSGSTNLYDIFSTTDNNDITRVGNGLNTYTGGTANNPTVNISGLTIDNLNVSGNSRFVSLSATTLSGGTIISGSTDLQVVFNLFGSQLNTKANLSGATFTGQITTPSISATTLSASTINSGSTNLYNIFQQIGTDTDHTRIQNGLNTYTGGTSNLPTVNISAATLSSLNVSGNSLFNTLSANTLSGGTIYSGSTNIENIIQSYIADNITLLQDGLNTYTGGTKYRPTVNVSGLTVDNIYSSGNSRFNSITASTLSATTLYSGATNLNDLFADKIHSHVQYATLSGATFTGAINVPILSATTFSAATIISGSTDLYAIFQTIGSDIPTYVQNGLNTYTGGTSSSPTINVSGLTIDNIFSSGNSRFNALSASTISGSTLYSGSTNVETIINNYVVDNLTFAQDGLNTYTGGTKYRPIINVSAATLDNLTVSGSSVLSTLSATSISAATVIYSAGTELSQYFTKVQSGLNTYTGGTSLSPTVNVSGLTIDNISISGESKFNTLSANTVSASTYFMSTQQIYGNVISASVPINAGNVWIRNTDYEQFIYDAVRTKWLSTSEQRLTGTRASNNVTTQFLRVEDSQVISNSPFRVPYDATIVRIVMGGNVSQTWQAVVTTGTTIGTDNIAVLDMSSNIYSAKTDYNVNINSGQTLYVGFSGSSISQPRVDVYFKRRGE